MTSAAPNLGPLFTKREACEFLGKSMRTIDAYIKAGTLPASYISGPNGKETRFSREDVMRLKTDLETPTLRPVAVPAQVTKELARTIQEAAPAALPAMTTFADAFAASLGKALRPEEPKPWLTLAEASEYSGLSQAYLLRGARAGEIKAVKGGTGGAWCFNREALGR